ncbi:MAG: Dessication-associated protein [Flavipsychrobacter sp.]|jgi:hypothetical protein|nr:Dessication-associated protein [Flavipsychrobacter sp.]
MNFKNILHEIEKNDPEVYEKLSGRRDVLKSFGSKVAVVALPVVLGSLFKKAYGKTTDVVVDSLNFMLELEYIEYTFYRTATNTGGLIPAKDLAGFKTIESHEKAHIQFFIDTIIAAGGTPFVPKHYSHPTTNAPYVPAAYDFTKGGAYAPFANYNHFLMLAQVFEDTGVRAYNEQSSIFWGSALYTQLQQITATEARHAAHARLIRRNLGAVEVPAPWVTNDIAPITDFLANYDGEQNTKQLDVEITALKGHKDDNIPRLSASAAFDEPLNKATVVSLMKPFILP